MGQSKQTDGQEQAVPEVDAAVEALNRIADAIILLARATAGEFDDDEEAPQQFDMAGRPLK